MRVASMNRDELVAIVLVIEVSDQGWNLDEKQVKSKGVWVFEFTKKSKNRAGIDKQIAINTEGPSVAGSECSHQ